MIKKKLCHAYMRCMRGGAQSGFLDSFPFDPAGLNSDTNQTKELKNGRLAVRSSHSFPVGSAVWQA